jgi:hypothetical protein
MFLPRTSLVLDLSPEVFDAKVRLLVGLKKDTGKHYCTFCNKEFSSLQTASNHIKVKHFDREDFQCGYCPAKFKTSTHKAVHVHNKHRGDHKKAKVFGGALL